MMIYTVTLNPCVDYDVYFDGFQESGLNFSKQVNYRAAGKGINVSKVLHNLGMPVITTGFIGGFTGDFIEDEMNRIGIDNHFVRSSGVTRINIKLSAKGNEQEITGISPPIEIEQWNELMDLIKQTLSGDIVVFSGSIPKGLQLDCYKIMAEQLPDNVIKILDTRGDLIKQNMCRNYLIKPNLGELSEMFNTSITAGQNGKYVVDYAVKLLDFGVENVIVSMGADGAIFVSRENCFYAAAPKGNIINTMGAGDSVVAGFIYGIQNKKSKADAFRMAVACGSATAFSLDMCSKKEAEELYKQIIVEEI